jgi:hypothetical protein
MLKYASACLVKAKQASVCGPSLLLFSNRNANNKKSKTKTNRCGQYTKCCCMQCHLIATSSSCSVFVTKEKESFLQKRESRNKEENDIRTSSFSESIRLWNQSHDALSMIAPKVNAQEMMVSTQTPSLPVPGSRESQIINLKPVSSSIGPIRSRRRLPHTISPSLLASHAPSFPVYHCRCR